jgi:hypothetical protein
MKLIPQTGILFFWLFSQLRFYIIDVLTVTDIGVQRCVYLRRKRWINNVD